MIANHNQIANYMWLSVIRPGRHRCAPQKLVLLPAYIVRDIRHKMRCRTRRRDASPYYVAKLPQALSSRDRRSIKQVLNHRPLMTLVRSPQGR